jgi:hypothetical protein
MNDLIAKLYDQATVLEGNGDYVAGELNPVKFAELIVRECADIAAINSHSGISVGRIVKEHFGVK